MKLKIRLTPNDKNIPIQFNGINNLLGYDDDMQSLVNSETDSSINSSTDLEVRRFKTLVNDPSYFRIYFYFWDGSDYTLQLAPFDFAANGLDETSSEARNSFYVIQVFDSFDESIQKKIHTGYFNGYEFIPKSDTGGLSTDYNLNNYSEFVDIYIPNYFLEGKGDQIELYAKFLFYSAQSGKFYPFSKINGANKVEDIYQKLTLNLNNYTYTFETFSFTLFEITNPEYSELINNTVSSIPVQKPVYPSGNTFTVGGTYVTI